MITCSANWDFSKVEQFEVLKRLLDGIQNSEIASRGMLDFFRLNLTGIFDKIQLSGLIDKLFCLVRQIFEASTKAHFSNFFRTKTKLKQIWKAVEPQLMFI